MEKESLKNNEFKPEILAPAGNKVSFLAAIAAGADAVYCGLKNLSARMEASNFGTEELASLTKLAHTKGIKVYVTLNSLVKPGDSESAVKLLDRLSRDVKPDAIIIQDLAFVKFAEEVGFKGEIHLSTLGNMSSPSSLELAKKKLGISRVVIPRELNIDEIKGMAKVCPDNIDLEAFIHGALCYGVSGRCYWSSFYGGKSGLRGRCVQPCRRIYDHKGQKNRYFSCQDLSLDVLVKVLKDVPKIKTWKIEGRKKGPHYVYYSVQAYKMLRDNGSDPSMKKTALGLLDQALGRSTTHYNFLPQRPQNPVDVKSQTGSGLLLGKVQGPRQKPYLVPRQGLLPGDLLRLGYEDEPGHMIQRVTISVPKRGKLYLKKDGKKVPGSGKPVFLVDRREKELEKLIADLDKELNKISRIKVTPSAGKIPVTGKRKVNKKAAPLEMVVGRRPGKRSGYKQQAIWLTKDSFKSSGKGGAKNFWWWLPPVIWPEDEETFRDQVGKLVRSGVSKFVLNSPWQVSLFPEPKGKKRDSLELWAGPFCNQANIHSIDILKTLGFSGVIVSPELTGNDYRELGMKSPLPVGIVTGGNWPLVIARTLAEELKTDSPFKSPKGEESFTKRLGSDFWTYPNWVLNLDSKKDELRRAGFSLFVHMEENIPKNVRMKQRKGLWNWDLRLL